MFSSVRRITHGCYSVIRDDDNVTSSAKSDSSFVLDAFYFIGVPEKWADTFGGHITYVAKNEQEEVKLPPFKKKIF